MDYRQVMALQERWGASPGAVHALAFGFMSFALRTRGDPAHVIPSVRRTIALADPQAGIDAIAPVDRLVANSVARQRFYAVMLAGFAAIAALLGAIGIYGVLAYAVSQRKREIGIRLALGADGGRVVAMVVGQGMLMASVGVVVGTATAWFLTGTMEGLLYGVEAQDPATFLTVPALFAAVALFASWVPAARAARVRPAATLREE